MTSVSSASTQSMRLIVDSLAVEVERALSDKDFTKRAPF
jgi:hypothetical protein